MAPRPYCNQFRIRSNKSRVYAVSSGSQKGVHLISPHSAPALSPHFKHPVTLHLSSMELASDTKRNRYKRFSTVEEAQLWLDEAERRSREKKQEFVFLGEGEGLGVGMDLDLEDQSQCQIGKVQELDPEEPKKIQEEEPEPVAEAEKPHVKIEDEEDKVIMAISQHLAGLSVSKKPKRAEVQSTPLPVSRVARPPSPPLSPPSSPSQTPRSFETTAPPYQALNIPTPPHTSPTLSPTRPTTLYTSTLSLESPSSYVVSSSTPSSPKSSRENTPSSSRPPRRRHSHPPLPTEGSFSSTLTCHSSAYDQAYASLPSSIRESLEGLLVREDVLRGMRMLASSSTSSVSSRRAGLLSTSSSSSSSSYGSLALGSSGGRHFPGNYTFSGYSSTSTNNRVGKRRITSACSSSSSSSPGSGSYSAHIANMGVGMGIGICGERNSSSAPRIRPTLRLGIIKTTMDSSETGKGGTALMSVRRLGRRGPSSPPPSSPSSHKTIDTLLPPTVSSQDTYTAIQDDAQRRMNALGAKMAEMAGTVLNLDLDEWPGSKIGSLAGTGAEENTSIGRVVDCSEYEHDYGSDADGDVVMMED